MSESGKTLLVEIRTEELPPLLLGGLADSFSDSLLEKLRVAGFTDSSLQRRERLFSNKWTNREEMRPSRLVTPRRLTALLENILAESPPEDIIRHGPQLAACYDSSGAPTKALSGFMRSVGATSKDDLHQAEEKGKTFIAWRGQKPARLLSAELASLVENTLFSMRAPRLMRWGDNDFRFIRPVRGVLLLHGNNFIDGKIMGVAAGRTIKGHPIMHGGDIEINNAEEYESVLLDKGHVIVEMDKRWEKINKDLQKEIPAGYNPKLWDFSEEVVAMCEYPKVIKLQIDKEFMELPKECIIECMAKQQRAFYTVDSEGELSRDYCIVVDNMPEDGELMCRGYDAVLRARLRDVQFYYEEDLNVPLSDYEEKLKGIVFHSKIGTQYERIERACKIGDVFLRNWSNQYSGIDFDFREAACKYLAPLPSLMVGEYPDLHESMVDIYFYKEEKQYEDMPFVANCFGMEKIVGMFGVGERPSGSKDPHGLRRCARNIVIQCLLDSRLDSGIREVIDVAIKSFDGKIADVHKEVYDFILDRMKFVLSPAGSVEKINPAVNLASIQIKNSVLMKMPDTFRDVIHKIIAVGEFAKTPEAVVLSAADKRTKNIFRKSSVDVDDFAAPNEFLFQQDEERKLWQEVKTIQDKNDEILRPENRREGQWKFTDALMNLSAIAPAVNAFFEKVLVNVEDEKIRNNRFALLAQLRKLLNQVADISCLSR